MEKTKNRDYVLKVRLNEDEKEKLDWIVENYGYVIKSRAGLFRAALNSLYDELQKEEDEIQE